MRKNIFSVFISVIMLLTSLVSITASAEESSNILETYTFEEFMELSEEEICAISDEITEEYNKRFTSCKSILNGNVLPCINVVTYDTYATITEQSDALCIPTDFMDISGSTTNFHITMKWNYHTDNTYADFVAKTYIWLKANPKIDVVTFCSLCIPVTKPDTTETSTILETYTFEEFLALSEEEICAISDDAAEAYAYYEKNSSGAENGFILHVLIDESYKESNMAELFMYPDDMIDGGYEGEAYIADDYGETRVADCTFNFERYLINSGNFYDVHLRSAIVAWFYLNPVSLLCNIETSVFEFKIGDIDQNGTIDISDATEALTIYERTAAGLSVENYTEQRINADVNKDSVIDLSDATAILMYYAQNAAGLQPTWDTVLA